jgi:hypothetical protein
MSAEENNYYVYMYLREDGTPYYVGKGIGRRAYKKDSRTILPPEDKTRIVFAKKNLTEKEAFDHEIKLIAFYGRKDKGTGILRNLTDGGEGASGMILSEESKNKIGKAIKGRKYSEETRKKMSQAQKIAKQHLLGKPFPEELRKKMVAALPRGEKHPAFGKKVSEETRKKMSLSRTGKKHSEETRKKLSNCKRSEEFKSKISKHFSGSIYITDGVKTRVIRPNETIPDGWRKGGSNVPKGSIYITDGTKNKRITTSETIPDGWRKGRVGHIKVSKLSKEIIL